MTTLETLNQAHDAWVRAVGDAAEVIDNFTTGSFADRLRETSLAYDIAVQRVLGETKQDLAVSVLRELLARMEREHAASTASLLPRVSDRYPHMVSAHMRRRSPIEATIGELEAWKEDVE